MEQITNLRSLYDSPLGAKRAYHSLVASHLQDQLHVERMRKRLNTLNPKTMATTTMPNTQCLPFAWTVHVSEA